MQMTKAPSSADCIGEIRHRMTRWIPQASRLRLQSREIGSFRRLLWSAGAAGSDMTPAFFLTQGQVLMLAVPWLIKIDIDQTSRSVRGGQQWRLAKLNGMAAAPSLTPRSLKTFLTAGNIFG